MRTTKNYRKYIRLYGHHFTKELCEYATSMMENEKGPVVGFTKREIEEKLQQQGIVLEHNKLYDAVYVANMCRADFLGRSIQDDDFHLCQYIKDVIDDPDGYDGQPFARWIADMEATHTPVDWSEFV